MHNYEVKEASLKRPHTVRFQRRDILERQNHGDTTKSSALYPVVVGPWRHAVCRPIGRAKPEVNLKASHGLRVLMPRWCSFIRGQKRARRWRAWMGSGAACCRAGPGKYLYLPLPVAVDVKLLQKINYLKIQLNDGVGNRHVLSSRLCRSRGDLDILVRLFFPRW